MRRLRKRELWLGPVGYLYHFIILVISLVISTRFFSPKTISRRFVGSAVEGVLTLFIGLSMGVTIMITSNADQGMATQWVGMIGETLANYHHNIGNGN